MPTTQQLIEFLQPRYPAQIRFLFEGGKLYEKDGWDNVVGHCLIQAAAMEILGELLDLHPRYTRVMAEVAAAHNGMKRFDRRPDDFTADEKKRAIELQGEALPTELHWELMDALNPHFHLLVKRGKAGLKQRLQFYVDDIASPDGDKLIPFDERIDEVSARNPNPEPEVEQELGRPYWEAERELGHKVEWELWEMLRTKGVPIAKPRDIPEFLNREIEKRFSPVMADD